MYSLKQDPATYLCSKVKKPAAALEGDSLVIGKTEQRAVGAGQEHRGKGSEVSQAESRPSCIRQPCEGPLTSAVGAVCPLGMSPRLAEPQGLQLSTANIPRSTGRNGFPFSEKRLPGNSSPRKQRYPSAYLQQGSEP